MDSRSSRWPLPATPAMPSTSPALTVKLTLSRRLTPSSSNTVKPSSTRRGVTFTGSGRSMFRLTLWPTIISVRDCWSASLVATSPIYSPLRSTATRSETSSTSWSLWVMMMRDLPSAFMFRMICEQLVRLLRRQDGGRLVQNQNIRAPVTVP